MSTKNIPRISETEWEVMRAVWSQNPATANEIIERLWREDPTWHPKTAKTLLTRLVQKKALDYETRGRTFVYEPLVTERECIAAASESFLDRVFGGSLRPMLVHLVESQQLTSSDLDELRALLESQPAPPKHKPRSKP